MSFDNSPGHRQVVWNSIFQRRGGASLHTNLFEKLGTADQLRIESDAPPPIGDEIRVLASVLPGSGWCLLTTSRLITGEENQGVRDIPVGDIADVRVDLPRVAAKGLTKSRFQNIQVVSASGEQLEVVVEPGPSYNGVLSVLMQIAKRNRSARLRGNSGQSIQPPALGKRF